MKSLIILFAFVISSCSTTSSYIGTWKGNKNKNINELTIKNDGSLIIKGRRSYSKGMWRIKDNKLFIYSFGKKTGISGKIKGGVVYLKMYQDSFKLLPEDPSNNSTLTGNWYANEGKCIDEDRKAHKLNYKFRMTFNSAGDASFTRTVLNKRCGLIRKNIKNKFVEINGACAMKVSKDGTFQCYLRPIVATLSDGNLKFIFKRINSYELMPVK